MAEHSTLPLIEFTWYVKPTRHECLMNCVPQQATLGPQAIRMLYCPLAPTFDPVRRPQLSPGSQDVRLLYCPLAPLIIVRRPQLSPGLSIILLADPYLRFRSADHNFLPARRPSCLLYCPPAPTFKKVSRLNLCLATILPYDRQGAHHWMLCCPATAQCAAGQPTIQYRPARRRFRSADHSIPGPPAVCLLYCSLAATLLWSAGHGSFFSACRPYVCYTARWPTFNYGPTTTLSTGTQVVRLLYCPLAPTYDLVRRPQLFPAGLPAVYLPYTASWPLL